ncbi:MAG: lactate utilization protein [Candidatus Methanoperedens sp.]|nr:lactate utilization protein [Candidatus Methanoperedens sp.]MCE8427205.1 lactate utilization protein [Candidatus Methanoperedens sp.]
MTKYDMLASKESIKKATEALKARNIIVELVDSRADALRRINQLIPAGKEVMTGGSTTLDEIGFTDLLKSGKHPWKNLKDKILSEKDPERQMELRKKSITSEYFLGSVHAVAETGEILIVNATGSSIPSAAFSSDNVIWIVGTQKIVPALEDGFKRIREYCVPLEDKRMKSVGYPGTTIGKYLIFEREINPNRKVTLIFVNEKLGF